MKMKKVFIWLVMNGFICGMLVYGILHDNPLKNLAAILIWFNLAMTTLALLMSSHECMKQAIRKHHRSVPLYVSVVLDMSLVAFLGYYGWTITAFSVVLQALFEYIIFQKADELRAEEADQ